MSETLDQEVTLGSDKLKINDAIIYNLTIAAKWTKFLAIVGFIAIGFMFLGALIILVQAANVPSGLGIGEQLMLMAIIYIVFAGLFLIPTLNMLRFSNHSKKAVTNKSQGDLEIAFINLKGFFKFCGIYTIVLLGIYIIIIFSAAFLSMSI